MAEVRPLVGLSTDRPLIGGVAFHVAEEGYSTAIVDVADGLPVLIPSLGPKIGVDELLGRVDGLLFTGSESNVQPHHYAGPDSATGTLYDPARDATTLPLIRRAIAKGIPLFGICRGFQEINVALGGSLHQRVHELPGYLDHRDDDREPAEIRYSPAHEVNLEPGGFLRALAGVEQVRVNSRHWQGIERLGRDLAVEARAPDGLIEAFRLEGASRFALAVQWHPEWRVTENPFSRALFAIFGAACRDYARYRR